MQTYIVNKMYKGVFILDKLGIEYDREIIKKASQYASKINFDPFNFDYLPSIEEIEEEVLEDYWDLELPNDLTLFLARCRMIIKLDAYKDCENNVDYNLPYGRYSISTLDEAISNL